MASFDWAAAQRYEELNTRMMFAVAALSVYEYSITFSQEVQTVWKRKATALSMVLLIIRWTLLVGAVGYVLIGARASSASCTAAWWICGVVESIGYVLLNVYTSLKISAMWGGNKFLFASSFALGLTPVLTDVLEAADYRNAYSLQFRCYNTLPPASPKSLRSYTISAQATCAVLLAQDVLILGLTLTKTFSQWWQARKLRLSLSVTASILRGGTIHFVILMSLLIAQMVMVRSDGIMEEVLAPLLAAMPLILTSRVMMELRMLTEKPDDFGDGRQPERQTYFHRSIREVQRSLSIVNSTHDNCFSPDAGEL